MQGATDGQIQRKLLVLLSGDVTWNSFRHIGKKEYCILLYYNEENCVLLFKRCDKLEQTCLFILKYILLYQVKWVKYFKSTSLYLHHLTLVSRKNNNDILKRKIEIFCSIRVDTWTSTFKNEVINHKTVQLISIIALQSSAITIIQLW